MQTLNPKYTFDNLCIGDFNELAHATALAIVESPGLTYNPFVVYGNPGLGKTHLIQAIGNKIKEKYKVRYITCNELSAKIVIEIRTKDNIDGLKKDLSYFDVLIIDDIQFLAGKNRSQEEFLNIIRFLYEKGKQIIAVSDKPPMAIPVLNEGMCSQFERGMIIDIGTPDYQVRLSILRNILKKRKTKISEYILEYIASNKDKNISELEGAVNNLLLRKKIRR